MSRVLLVDDHATFREPLSFMFDREPGFEVVAQAGSLEEARGALEDIDFAVVVLDLPDGNGTELIGPLRATNPRCLVMVLTASADREAHARAVEAGAAGVLHKSARVGEVVRAAHRLVAGESLLSTEEVVDLLRLAGQSRERDREAQRSIERLTPREREVLQALADGLSERGDIREPARRRRDGQEPPRERLRQARGQLAAAGARLRPAPRRRGDRLSGRARGRCPSLQACRRGDSFRPSQ